MFPFLLILVLSAGMGFQGWRIILNNFAKEEAGIDGFGIGIIQSFREVPGLMVFLVVYVLLIIKEHKLSSLSVIIMGAGVALTGFFPDLIGLTLTTVLMSVGFHYFETTHQSLTLQHFNKQEAPIFMSTVRSLRAIGNILIGGLIILLWQFISYQSILLIIGIAVMIVGAYTLFMDPIKRELPQQKKKILLKKKYWLYYVLNFLSGARRQIFVVFAVFLLVENYAFTVSEIAFLFVLNNVFSYFVNPIIGRSINKYGERKVLSFEYIGLFLVFSGYVFVTDRFIIAALYIIDHLFFNFAIGLNTYLQKIADPEDIAPSTSVGFAINHITAVFIPIIGGLLWVMYDYRIPFAVGAILTLFSLFFVQKIRVEVEKYHSPSKLT